MIAKSWQRLVIALFLAWNLQPSQVTASEAGFKLRCAGCHARAATLARSLKGSTSEEVIDGLMKFLEQHHAPDPAERQSIAAYLAGLKK